MTRGEDSAREAVLGAAQLLSRSGIMSPTGHVSLSALLGAQTMLLTASGVVHDLEPDDLAVVGFDGQVADGRLKTSTREIVGMHTAVYRTRADAAAVVHTHSPFLTAFALAARPLPCRYEPMLRRGQPGAVPVSPWGPRGSDVAVRGIADTLRARPATSAVLLSNHGVLAFSTSALEAAKLVIVLEEGAAAEIRATALGGATDFPPGALEDVRRSMAAARRASTS